MIPLLHHNNINSNVPINTFWPHITEYKLDHLYPITVSFADYSSREPMFFRQDHKTEYKFGHNLLMYRTDFDGLSRL